MWLWLHSIHTFHLWNPKDSHPLHTQGSLAESHPPHRCGEKTGWMVSIMLAEHKTRTLLPCTLLTCFKSIQGFGRATSRAGTPKSHCMWTKDVNGHTDPSPLPEQIAEQDDLRSIINSPHLRIPQSSDGQPKPSRFCNCRHHKILWDLLMYGCASRAEQ